MTTRRGFLTGLGAIICSPAIVRASSLMPVKAIKEPLTEAKIAEVFNILDRQLAKGYAATTKAWEDNFLYGTGFFAVSPGGLRLLTANSVYP